MYGWTIRRVRQSHTASRVHGSQGFQRIHSLLVALESRKASGNFMPDVKTVKGPRPHRFSDQVPRRQWRSMVLRSKWLHFLFYKRMGITTALFIIRTDAGCIPCCSHRKTSCPKMSGPPLNLFITTEHHRSRRSAVGRRQVISCLPGRQNKYPDSAGE